VNSDTHAVERGAQVLHAEVLVIGGGPAGAWAALSARQAGAERVVLVDKGYCGTSGATASANTGVWCVGPDRAAREHAIERRLAQSAGLGQREVMEAVLETTWQRLKELSTLGYAFPLQDDGEEYRANLRGPDYMAFMRQQLKRARVTILDHSPALELLEHDGVVAGAAGQRLHTGEAYQVHAGAVVVASGGVAFLSKTLGCDVNTGDGLLMAAEAGAQLSGMEFSSQYGICPAYSSVTKGLPYIWATFTDGAGQPIEAGENRLLALGRALLRGPVFAVLDKATPEVQRWLREGQPNCFLPHDRMGLDPFRERFPIALRCEGTVRGTGGIRILEQGGRTHVPGLYAAGDAASREALVGAATGGGAPNAAWAISSGSWAGQAAASFARGVQRRPEAERPLAALGGIGLRPTGQSALGAASRPLSDELITLVQSEILPLDKNLFRTEPQLLASLARLESAFREARVRLAAHGRERVRAREAAALLSCARYAYKSALLRSETRGLHQRVDRPAQDPRQSHSWASTGLDPVKLRPYRYPNEALT